MVVSNICYFHPCLRRWSNLTNLIKRTRYIIFPWKSKSHVLQEQVRPQRRLKRLGSKAPACANGSFQVGSDVSLGGGGLLPRCGFVNVQSGTMSVTPFALRLPKTPPLSLMCVHKSKLKVKKDGKTKVFSGKKKFASWSSIRCFSSTTTAVLRNPSPRGICDLANRIRYSTKFNEGKKGLPLPEPRSGGILIRFSAWLDGVCRGTFEKMFPHVSADVLTKNEGKIPVVSFFSGIAGLELGLARWVHPTTMAERDSACRITTFLQTISSDLRDSYISLVWWQTSRSSREEMTPRRKDALGDSPVKILQPRGWCVEWQGNEVPWWKKSD